MNNFCCVFLFAMFLSGCGAMSGGATYRVEVTNPDGTMVRASADVVSESDSVEAEFVRDSQGVKSVRFSKQGTRQAEQTMLELLREQTRLLEALLPVR